MCIERLQEIVKGTFELELKRRAEELAKPLGDGVMKDLMGEITACVEDEMAEQIVEARRQAFREAYAALKKEFEAKEEKAFKRGVEYGKGIARSAGARGHRRGYSADDVCIDILNRAFGW